MLINPYSLAVSGGGGGINTTPGTGVVTWQAAGAYDVKNVTPLTPAFPASIAAGDLLVLFVGSKYGSSSITTPSGWTALASLTDAGGYGATTGANVGNTCIFAFHKTADGSETGTLSVAFSSVNVAWATIHRLSKNSGTWNIEGTTGQDTTGGNVSVTFDINPSVLGGDHVLTAMAVASNANAGAAFSAGALSQTGATFGTVTEVAEVGTNVGDNMAGAVWEAAVSSGTGSIEPTLSATSGGTSTDMRGAEVFVRVRAL
jgi:MSHA biogenesis protein MshQ